MSRRKQKNVDKTVAILFTIVVLCLLVVIAIFNAVSKNEEVEYTGETVGVSYEKDPNIEENKNEAEIERLQAMTERARIEYYASKFLNYVEAEDYDSAYNLLNSTYKKNYFSTQDKFEEYVKANFSKMMSIEYTNFERSGEVYVIWMTITDAINGGPNSGKEINFVVKENDFNDFELSFSAN